MTNPTTETAQTDPAIHPVDILMSFIVAFLAPMFLSASGGDIGFARMAAIETITAYRARSPADLIAIAQLIGCGLAALGSLSLSMADNLSLSMTLRLRGNAVSLNRAAEQNRRALRAAESADLPADTDSGAQPAFQPHPDDARFEAEVLASVAAAQQATAAAQVRLQTAKPAPIPATPQKTALTATVPTTPAVAIPAITTPTAPAIAPTARTPIASTVTDEQRQAMWATAMADVAGEFTTGLHNLPPEERRLASRRAAALSSCAQQLLTGNVPPAPQPSDLAAITETARAPESPAYIPDKSSPAPPPVPAGATRSPGAASSRQPCAPCASKTNATMRSDPPADHQADHHADHQAPAAARRYRRSRDQASGSWAPLRPFSMKT
jgi:hypothetical protein